MASLAQTQAFWEHHPCGERLVGPSPDWRDFFEAYDRYRYATEGHILDELDRLDLAGKEVLEIGIGQAADSAQIIRRGATWHGLDLTAEAIARARTRFEIFGLPFASLSQGRADRIPFPDASFDLVYSHGVLHHIPDIRAVSAEIRRVLRPDGAFVAMLYHRHSLNYRLSINVIRRVGLAAVYLLTRAGGRRLIGDGVVAGHVANAERFGLATYLRNPLFMSRNTDGPENPYSKVYDRETVEDDFREFAIRERRCHFLNDRHLPFLRLLPESARRRLAARYGWHLWVTLTPA